MNVHEFAELSAGRALRALAPDEERAFLEALIAHPEWQAIADADLETTAALADGAAPVEPPAGLRAQLLARIGAPGASDEPESTPEESTALDTAPTGSPAPALDDDVDLPPTVAIDPPFAPQSAAAVAPSGEPGILPADAGIAEPVDTRPAEPDAAPAAPEPPARPTVSAEEAALRAGGPPTEVIQAVQRRNWTRGVFALVASIALLVGIGWGVGAITDAVRTPAAVTALEQIESAADAQSASADIGETGSVTLHWSDAVGEAVLVASGLPNLDDDRTFEVWFVRGDQPVSAGTFDASAGDATAELDGEPQQGDTIAITVEPSGGAPDGVPTSDPIVAITTSES